MELWMTEWQTPNLGLTCRVNKTLYSGKSEFQEIAVVEAEQFGRMLVLDGVFQTSIFDEFTYHEMITHVPMLTHPNPRKVLVIGGGDGGTVREVVKHQCLESVEMVEIDGQVIAVSKQFLPEISAALIAHHPKLSVTVGDGIAYMKKAENQYDIIIVDCSDPIGPGEGLFTYDFYQNVYKALKKDGMFVQQTESPFYHQPLIKRLSKDISSLFPIMRTYLSNIPLYPGGLHCFTLGSKQYDPLNSPIRKADFATRYYNADIHKSSFMLPNFMKNFLPQR